MFSRKAFWSVTLSVLVLGAAAGVLLGNSMDKLDAQSHASWKQVFRNPGQLSRGVDAVALVKVNSVQPGRVATSSNGEAALQYYVYDLEVVRGIRGVEAGDTLQVERANALDGGREVRINVDGGPYELGATYMLFLNRQEDGGPYYYQVNHQGRYLVAENKLYSVDPNDEVGGYFEGLEVNEGIKLVREFEGPKVQ
jgi:hypothetical protein